MASLGFPEAAIRNIKSIYTNATTVIATPFGDTGAVHIGRGTIQGDTLSPYLFLIFIEPLLRWLQQGGRGYAPGCLAETQFPKTIAALAYADDLNALTSSLSNLKLQAQKVERFAQWSGMEVNARKCAASAILHGQAAAGLVKRADDERVIKPRLEGKINMGNGPVPYLPPDEPYKYLGIFLTLTLNWGHQYRASLNLLVEQAAKLQSSFATPAQKLQVFRSKIIAALRYVFSTSAFSPMDIKRLDAAMTRFAKGALGLMNAVPNALVHEDIDKGGMGMTSLLQPYVHEQTTTIVKSLHDGGRLGYITRLMLVKQITYLGMVTGIQHWQESRHCSLARKIAFMHDAGINLKGPMEIALKGNALNNVMKRLQGTIKGINVNKINRIVIPLYELGIYDFSKLTNAGGKRMIDADALSRLPGLCTRVTNRHKKALNRITLLLNGQDWVENGPAHAYSKATALPVYARTVLRSLSMADIGCEQGGSQRKIDSFPCTLQPEDPPVTQHADASTTKSVLESNPAVLVPHQTEQGAVVGPSRQGKPAAAQVACPTSTGIWSGRTRTSVKRKVSDTNLQVASAQGLQHCTTKPDATRPRRRRRRRNKAHLPLLSRESADIAACTHSTHMQWGWLEPQVSTYHNEIGVCIGNSKICKVADFETIRNLYNDQDSITSILAHRLVDGGLQQVRARKSFAHEKGCQVQFLVQWEDSLVRQEHLHILEENGYTASKVEKLRGFGTGPARFMVKASWEATWEPEDRLCQDDAHRNLVNEYRAMHLDVPPRKLWASNIDQQQPVKLQQGLNAKQAAYNAYNAGLKERLRISTDPINPDLDIHATGQAAIQCEMISDCYAQDGDNETQGTMRALAFNAEGHYISSISPDRMGLLQHWHRHLDVFEEDVVALLQRYKHGNESTGHTVQINDLWQLSPDLHDCLRATFPICHERFASPLDVHATTRHYWTPFAADSAFGAETDCYSDAWKGCSQANPPSADEEMDKAVRWAMASALITDQPVLTVMSLAYKSSSAFTKWLGHPFVHILLKCKRPARGNDTLRIPADFWLEDESVYKVRNKDVADAMMVLLVANRQGANTYCNAESLDALQASVANLEGIEIARPLEGSFPEGGASLRSYARHQPRSRLPKQFPSKPPDRIEAEQGPPAGPGASRQDLTDSVLVDFPCFHCRAHDPLSYSYSDGSAVKKGSEPIKGSKDRLESPGTTTGTGLVMAQSQRIVHIDPGAKDTTNTIVRAELVGVQAWLQEIMNDELAANSLNTHEPLLRDIVTRLKDLTDAGHHIHLGKVKAHMGVRGKKLADAAAKAVVTQKILDADPDNMVNSFSTQELREAQIDKVCQVNNNAHEHDEWPVHPIPTCQRADDRYLEDMEKMLIEGTWPDGDVRRANQGKQRGSSDNTPPADTRSRVAQQPADLRATEEDSWQAQNLSTSLSRALSRSCRLGYSNVEAVYVRLWRDVQPMLVPEQLHLFWDRFSRGDKRVKTGTVRNALRLRYGAFWNAKLAVRFQ